jgi:SAM-dependent methyltransferase
MRTGTETYSSAIAGAANYAGWILDQFAPYIGRVVLEVGFGHGGYRHFLPSSVRYIGVDIDAASVERAQQRYPEDEFLRWDVTDRSLVGRLRAERVDTVLCVNVLEHLADDSAAVGNLFEVLSPGGHLLIFVPAFQFLYTDLDRMAGHVRRYRRRDLQKIVSGSGRLVWWRYFNSVGGIGWWVNGLFRHDSLNAPAVNQQIESFDRYLVPVARLVDQLTGRFFGQSLVCVVEKA